MNAQHLGIILFFNSWDGRGGLFDVRDHHYPFTRSHFDAGIESSLGYAGLVEFSVRLSGRHEVVEKLILSSESRDSADARRLQDILDKREWQNTVQRIDMKKIRVLDKDRQVEKEQAEPTQRERWWFQKVLSTKEPQQVKGE